MYWVLGASTIISLLVLVPRMEIQSPGRGVMAKRGGVVQAVTNGSVIVKELKSSAAELGNQSYPLKAKPDVLEKFDDRMLILPGKQTWQEPVVMPGQTVKKKELLARGVTRIFFQANVWIFAVLVLVLGSIWGIGKAAVYKLIPDYFPEEVGVVGGMVGVIGGLGGFVCPIVFGYLLEWTGLWSSCWMFMFALSVACLVSLHYVVQKMMKEKHPKDMRVFER
jgi:NNP family nitrate/nitrite transporter-like MFS transporter